MSPWELMGRPGVRSFDRSLWYGVERRKAPTRSRAGWKEGPSWQAEGPNHPWLLAWPKDPNHVQIIGPLVSNIYPITGRTASAYQTRESSIFQSPHYKTLSKTTWFLYLSTWLKNHVIGNSGDLIIRLTYIFWYESINIKKQTFKYRVMY